MPIILGNTEVVGGRLRAERDRLGLSQAELARIGDVSRNSQTAYETGKTPFTSDYLVLVTGAGVDPLFVITGERSAGTLNSDQAAILSAFDILEPAGRTALLYISCSLSGQVVPAAPINLPSTAALEEAFAGFLEGSPGLKGDELVRELAMSLPTLLRGAADEIGVPQSDRPGIPHVRRSTSDDDRHAVQQGQRT